MKKVKRGWSKKKFIYSTLVYENCKSTHNMPMRKTVQSLKWYVVWCTSQKCNDLLNYPKVMKSSKTMYSLKRQNYLDCRSKHHGICIYKRFPIDPDWKLRYIYFSVLDVSILIFLEKRPTP